MKFAITFFILLFSHSFAQTDDCGSSSSPHFKSGSSGSGNCTAQCDDSYECQSDTLTFPWTYCLGYYACYSTDITATYTFAYGAISNYYSDIASSYLYAYGFRAGLYAEIVSYYVYAYGFQSLYVADVESLGDVLYIYSYGYQAGYYADVLCYSGDQCRIYCGGEGGCLYTKFYCYSGATCYYDCSADSVCPTLYSGIGSDVSMEGDIAGEHHGGLTDEQIKAKHVENKKSKKEIAEKEQTQALEGEDEDATKARIKAAVDIRNDVVIDAIDAHGISYNLSSDDRIKFCGLVGIGCIIGLLLHKINDNYVKIM